MSDDESTVIFIYSTQTKNNKWNCLNTRKMETVGASEALDFLNCVNHYSIYYRNIIKLHKFYKFLYSDNNMTQIHD
jgi:hypothetical protein